MLGYKPQNTKELLNKFLIENESIKKLLAQNKEQETVIEF